MRQSWLSNFQPKRQTCWAKWKLNKRCFQNTVEQISFQNEVTLRYTNFYWSFNPKLCPRDFCFLERKCYFSPVNLETHFFGFLKEIRTFFRTNSHSDKFSFGQCLGGNNRNRFVTLTMELRRLMVQLSIIYFD